MSQQIRGQLHPDPQDLGHRRQYPWWLNPRLSASGKTRLSVDRNTLNRDGWKNSCLTDSSQHLLLDPQNLRTAARGSGAETQADA